MRGGGSATGTAKAVALTTGLPVVAIPTTYAGSEVTPVWGLTEGSRKTTGTDPAVLPRVVVYDPELTTGLPAGTSAASGLNALAHAAEALWAPQDNPVPSLLAEEAVRVLAAWLPAMHAAPADLGPRTELLYGAYLAGCAFAVTGSGVHHKICHVLGGAYALPHAETHAVVLPEVVAVMARTRPNAVARIGRALGTNDPAGALRALSARLGIPRGLRAQGLARTGSAKPPTSSRPLSPPGPPTPLCGGIGPRCARSSTLRGSLITRLAET